LLLALYTLCELRLCASDYVAQATDAEQPGRYRCPATRVLHLVTAQGVLAFLCLCMPLPCAVTRHGEAAQAPPPFVERLGGLADVLSGARSNTWMRVCVLRVAFGNKA
jgi:hypothetical protein